MKRLLYAGIILSALVGCANENDTPTEEPAEEETVQ